jgi:acyl-CoA reductase-like NAD-dependent aldehyde dehydrogenase
MERAMSTATKTQTNNAATTDIDRVSLLVRDRAYWNDENAQLIRSPWDGSPVARVPQMNRRDLEDAVNWAAERAKNCANWPVADRIEAMQAWEELLTRNKERLARLESLEMGKPITQTRRIGDMIQTRLKNLCYARKNLHATPIALEGMRLSERAHAIASREPLGLVGGILPFNSPVSALVWKIAPALLMGNAVIVKVSEVAPVAALTAASLLSTLKLPSGAVQVVNGLGSELGPVLSEHPAIRMISFTGGTNAGTDIMRRGASTLKRLVLECGSNDATLILADADLTAASKMLVNLGMRTYNGQICIAPKRCIVEQPVYQRFSEMVVAEAGKLVVGDPLDDATDLGPLVNATTAARVENQVREALAAGARLLCGGKRLAEAAMAPTVLADITPSNPIFREGAFGPVVSLIAATDPQHAVALANDSPYALRASIYTADLARGARLAKSLDYNGVAINSAPGVDSPQLCVAPRKLSGVGFEGVEASLLEYSQPKFIWMADWWGEGNAQ